MRRRIWIVTICCMACAAAVQEKEGGASESNAIRINQIGYYPNGPKIAIFNADLQVKKFYITTPDLQDTVFIGIPDKERKVTYSSEATQIADFSDLQSTGNFVVAVPGLGKSYPFEIRANVHEAVTKGAIKGFYFQRMSTTLTEEFAGKWARTAGHPDTAVFVHSSAATAKRPEGTVIQASLGWYDAGDYNKYIVNSGITMGTLLSLYEDFPEYNKNLSLEIPENENQLPDLLDEVLWNLRWMLAMQDPHDGGVYHKLTTANFEGMIMPSEANAPRYVIQKSTTAALDFAAVMAQAARVYGEYEREVPGLADSCLSAALKAWEWAQKNPDQLYDQGDMNEAYDPAISTGGYGDRNVSDEFVWAAAELWVTTGNEKFLKIRHIFPEDSIKLPSWGNVSSLGYYTLLRHRTLLEDKYSKEVKELKSAIVSFAASLIEKVPENAFATVMGGNKSDFIWGSNSVAANQGIALIQAYHLTGDQEYLMNALTNLDYLLGRNATGYSYVTGFGDKTPLYPHHRPSVADTVEAPIPGLLVGGPNSGQQDDCNYPSKVPDESYVDEDCSYASNEIAINWNAPFVYLAAAIEALQKEL